MNRKKKDKAVHARQYDVHAFAKSNKFYFGKEMKWGKIIEKERARERERERERE